MIKVKHFMDAAEPDDGMRIWVEPIGLTRDLVNWCEVDYVLRHLGPPLPLWDWLEEHPGPDAYDYFRGIYHEHLARSHYAVALRHLALASAEDNCTLLHQSDDPAHNSAVALYEFLSELGAHSWPGL